MIVRENARPRKCLQLGTRLCCSCQGLEPASCSEQCQVQHALRGKRPARHRQVRVGLLESKRPSRQVPPAIGLRATLCRCELADIQARCLTGETATAQGTSRGGSCSASAAQRERHRFEARGVPHEPLRLCCGRIEQQLPARTSEPWREGRTTPSSQSRGPAR